MVRGLLWVVAGAALAWVGVDVVFNYLRVADSYGRLFLF